MHIFFRDKVHTHTHTHTHPWIPFLTEHYICWHVDKLFTQPNYTTHCLLTAGGVIIQLKQHSWYNDQAMGWMTGIMVWFLGGARYISLLQNAYTRALSLEVKWPEHEADHSLSPNAKVKNAWDYTSIPLMCLHGMQRDGFTFYFPVNIMWCYNI